MRANILIVDDEENVRNALRRSLRNTEHRLVLADGPEMALKLLAREKFDIIISDHLMPGMTGAELLALARDRQPNAVRIMLTGHADMDAAIDVINRGEVYRFLTKPWDDTELMVTLHLACEKMELERENRRLLAMVRHYEEMLTPVVVAAR